MATGDIERVSIQRFSRPSGTDARWLADHYFEWLDDRVPIAGVRRRGEDVELRVVPFGRPAIELRETHSTPTRVTFAVWGGWLVRGPQGGTFEFRTGCEREFEVELRDFSPTLPRFIYAITQALVHAVVMWAFARHVRRLSRLALTEEPDGGSR
jgi:hypothetical protein